MNGASRYSLNNLWWLLQGVRNFRSLTITIINTQIHLRQDLLTLKLLDETVYTNAAGYLRIVDRNQYDGLNPFDDTRIHPKYYITEGWANLMIKEVSERGRIKCSSLRSSWFYALLEC